MALVAFAGSLALVQAAVVLLMLVGVVALLARRIRKREGTRSVHLTPEHALHFVEFAGRAYVVGTGPAAAPQLLLELPQALRSEAQGGADGEEDCGLGG